MIASATWQGKMKFDAVSDSGKHILLDADAAHVDGPSPVEAVLMALCACTSVDVVSILEKKRQPITGLVVSATAERATEVPKVFTHIRLIYRVSGGVSPKAMEDAVELSKHKYCSVSKMLEKSTTIEFAIEYADEKV